VIHEHAIQLTASDKLDMAEEVAARYDIDALAGLLAGARALAADAEISVAVLDDSKPARAVS